MHQLLNPENMREMIASKGGPFQPVKGMSIEEELQKKSFLTGNLGLLKLEDLPAAILLFNQMAGFEVTLRPEGETGSLLRY